MPRKRSAPKLAMIVALVLLLATTALAAAQSPDVLLPFVTGGGTQRVPAEQAEPVTPVDEGIPPLVEEEPDPNAPVGDSQDAHSGDYDVPADIAAIDAFNATQWTVQNNVGIGTQTPTEPLDIYRNGNNYTRLLVRNPHAGTFAQTQLYLNTNSSNGVVLQQFGTGYSATWNGRSLANLARLRTTSTVAGMILTTGGNYPLIMGTSDLERMRVTSDGKVGIGTTTPAHLLSIAHGPLWTNSSWGGAIELNNGSAIAWSKASSGYTYGIGHTDSGFYLFRSSANPGAPSGPVSYDLGIDNNGNVSIGTVDPLPDPQPKLHVKGSVRVSSGSFIDDGVTLNVPDYVFEPEYPLMSLDELRTYVATEKHLPNVPDEAEIRAGGLNLSEFQMKLLEKTEELALYTLAQDEQLKNQQQEIETLQQENQAMQQENQAKDEQLENQGGQIEALQQMIADLETRLAVLEEQAP